MKKSQMFVLSVVCAVMAICLVATPVHAVIIAADAFNGAQATLAGRSGGWGLDANNGWDSDWRNATGFGLGNTASMDTSGGGLMRTNTVAGGSIPGVILGTERLVKENQATNTYYFGMDVKFFNNTSSLVVASLFGMGFDVVGGAGPDALGVMFVTDQANNGGTQTTFHGNNKSGGQTDPGGPYAGNQFHRFVGRLTFQGGDGGNGGNNDELRLWVNPSAEGDAPGVNHVSQDLAADMDGLVVAIVGRDVYGHPGWEADNLVIATTFQEALTFGIPEPTTLSLLSLGLLGFGARRRRS